MIVSARYIIAWLGFLGTLTVYFGRLNLSIAIVSMVKLQNVKTVHNSTICSTNQVSKVISAEFKAEENAFEWSPGAQGDLLASYYYGYICTQAVGPWLATRIGYKKVWTITMILASILTLLTPLLAWTGYAWLFAGRVMVGLCHGVTFPVMHGMTGIWAPPLERSKMISIYVAGASVGTCILFPVAGMLIGTFGWPSVFYFTGAVSIIWCFLWVFLAFDSPETHPWISDKEKIFIIDSRQESFESSNIPWKKLLISKPVWAVAAGHLASNWGNYQLNSLLPTYLANVLQFDIKSNGFISSLPFIAQSFVCFFGGWCSDWLLSKGKIRIIRMRKINTGLGLLVPAITVVLAGYMGCHAELAVLFFVLSVGFNTFTVPGCKTAPLDFAPEFAGPIFAITNTVANLSGFLAPQITGHLLNVENSLSQWQLAFWISAMIYVPGFFLFQIYGTDELQNFSQ